MFFEWFDMPPRKKEDTGETSFTGIPVEMRKAAKSIAKRTGNPLRQIYDDAVFALADRMEAGETIAFRPSIPGASGKPYHTRMSNDAIEKMGQVCQKAQIHKSIFFRRALTDLLRAEGIDYDDND